MKRFGSDNLRIPKFQKPVYVVAGGMTDYRKKYPEKATEELICEAFKMAVEESDLKVDMAELKGMVNFCVYSQFADHFGDQLLAEARAHDALGLDPIGNIGVKTGGATGGSAVLAGAMAIASGYATCVPVIGWERMDEVGTREGNAYTLRTADRRNMEILLLPNETEKTYQNHTKDWPGFTTFLATRMAAYYAYHAAGIVDPVEELDLLETHDAFTISDVQTYGDIGLRPYGQERDFIDSGDAYFGGKLPTNLSGGLIGTMHSVGATGIMQIVEIMWQLQGKWAKYHAVPEMWSRFGKTKPEDFENLQVPDAEKGCAISHAGTGSHVTCAILEKP